MPTIFNIVVNVVVRHWESLVAGATGGGYQQGRQDRIDYGGTDNLGTGQRVNSGGRGTCTVEGASSVFLSGQRDGSLHLYGVDIDSV